MYRIFSTKMKYYLWNINNFRRLIYFILLKIRFGSCYRVLINQNRSFLFINVQQTRNAKIAFHFPTLFMYYLAKKYFICITLLKYIFSWTLEYHINSISCILNAIIYASNIKDSSKHEILKNWKTQNEKNEFKDWNCNVFKRKWMQ